MTIDVSSNDSHFGMLDLAVYVDAEGKRSRKEELLWHSTPLAISKPSH